MSETTACWRPASNPPDPRVDVLIFQRLKGFEADEDPYLIRIGYMNNEGRWVCTYGTAPDGADDILEGVTHWAPLPATPQPEAQMCPTPWPGDDCTVRQCVARGHCWCGAGK